MLMASEHIDWGFHQEEALPYVFFKGRTLGFYVTIEGKIIR